ncbi:uncharacterized protein L201_002398 [Kwoniella dendrophila CBS 6074]|uniref:Uncharacterized protein n=1 Tax=Kwoniella dendrophila CBS 6074 TaxID=1295534 RepID=A0AAX4JSS3_9TREE
MLTGKELKRRLKGSWNLFWPPWQDRGKLSTSKRDLFDKASNTLGNASIPENVYQLKQEEQQSLSKNSDSQHKPRSPEHIAREKEKIAALEKSKPAKEATEATEQAKTDDQGFADKGKGRMEGERPPDSGPSRRGTSDPSKSLTSDSSKDSRESKKDNTKSAQIPDPNTQASKSSTVPYDDQLMAGDHKPLKSSLKKSSKKPKQSKDIHHNFFMTMRGYRPSLIPFPHGFHPKPYYPRKTLWWDNVPRNADHIMASPKILKEPENADTADSRDKADSRKSKEKEKDNIKEKSSPSDGDKRKVDMFTKEKEKGKAEDKATAQKEVEYKAAKAKAEAARIPSSSSSAQSTQNATIPIDPKIQKATYLSQGLLSVLLYYLYPQLGFLLLLFFVWQYVNDQNRSDVPAQPTNSSPSSLSSISSRRSSEEEKAPEADLSAGLTRAPSSSLAPVDNVKKIEELDKLIAKLKTLPDLTPELKDKLKRTMMKREQMKSELKSRNDPEVLTSRKGKDKAVETPEEVEPRQQPKIAELERKAKEMDDYVMKARSIENPTEDQKAKLVKAEERRRELWKQVRLLKGYEPVSFMPPSQSEPASIAQSKIRNPSQNQSGVIDKKQEELKGALKQIEGYIMKYRHIEDPSEEQKAKLIKAEMQRKTMKKDLMRMMENSNIGSSGLSIDEKEALVDQKE